MDFKGCLPPLPRHVPPSSHEGWHSSSDAMTLSGVVGHCKPLVLDVLGACCETVFAVCTRRDSSNPRPALISIQATSLGRLCCLPWVELCQMRTWCSLRGWENGTSHLYTGVTEKCPQTLLKEQFKIFLVQTQKIPLCIDLKWLFGGSVFCDGMVTWSQNKLSTGLKTGTSEGHLRWGSPGRENVHTQ